MTTVLLDLDGTITDPARGIVAAMQHALRSLGADVPEGSTMTWMIGPPLRKMFPQLLGGSAQVEEAVRHYREHYTAGGLTNADVYAGMPEAIAALRGLARQRSGRLYVCTAKPTPFAVAVLEHFRLADQFDGIYGPELDGRLDNKAELMAHMIATERLEPAHMVMIGDRDNDIRAARANGVRSVGVLWGYGSRDELLAAGATTLCARPGELASVVAELGAGKVGGEPT